MIQFRVAPVTFSPRIVFAIFVTILACGCGSGELIEETIKQSYPIEPNGTISLTNQDGAIFIYGDHKPGLQFQAIKRAYSAARLQAIAINIASTPKSLTVRTTFPSSKKWSFSDRSGTVDYVITLPATCGVSRAELKNGEIFIAGMETGNVNASLENGRILIKNCFGNVTARSSTGALACIYEWWDPRPFSADARMTDGNVFATIPSNASFRIHAQALNGRIGNDFAEQEERTGAIVTKVDQAIGDSPTATINLTADDGNIKIIEANP